MALTEAFPRRHAGRYSPAARRLRLSRGGTPPDTVRGATRPDDLKDLTGEIRHLLRAPAAPAMERDQRIRAVAAIAGAGRAGRPARLRLRLGGRAPLPGGIFALLRARGVPRRGQPAHQDTSGSATASSSSPPTSRTAWPRRSRRSTWCRAAASSSAWARAPGRPSCTRSTSACATSASGGRRRCAPSSRCSPATSWEFHGQYYDFPARNVVPKPLQKPHPPLWVACSNIQTIGQAGEWGMGALGFSFVSPDAAQRLGAPLLQQLPAPGEPAGRVPGQSQHRDRQRLHVRADRRGGDRSWPSGWTFFIFALSYYGRKGVDAPGTGNLWHEYQDWRQTEQGAAGAAQRADRLAGNHPPAAAPVRGGACRSGDPAEPGRQDQPPGDLRQPRAVRARGDAGIPCPPTGSRRPGRRRCWPGAWCWRSWTPTAYDLYAHQNEDIVRLTPEQLKQRMAEKERLAQSA